jgi:GR25 family glycosyltransferase involved in LPS biosynthesis
MKSKLIWEDFRTKNKIPNILNKGKIFKKVKLQKTETFTIYTKYKDIYIINMDKDKDRLQNVKASVAGQNINIIRHPAINGKLIDKNHELYKKYLSNNFHWYKQYNKQSVIGCTLSHLTLYTELNNKYRNDDSKQYFIIAEDDGIIQPNFNERLEKLFLELPSNWDFVYLGASKPIGKYYSKSLIKPDFSKAGNWGFYGYMISKSGLQKFVNNSKNVSNEIDNHFKSIKGLNIFTCIDFLIKHDFDALSNNANRSRSSDKDSYEKVTIL